MFIPAFWCGVVATIFAEIAAIIAASCVWYTRSQKKKNKNKHIERE